VGKRRANDAPPLHARRTRLRGTCTTAVAAVKPTPLGSGRWGVCEANSRSCYFPTGGRRNALHAPAACNCTGASARWVPAQRCWFAGTERDVSGVKKAKRPGTKHKRPGMRHANIPEKPGPRAATRPKTPGPTRRPPGSAAPTAKCLGSVQVGKLRRQTVSNGSMIWARTMTST